MKKLLSLIEKNARMSLEEMASALNISANEVSEKLDKLKKDGIICGYRTVIDWDKTDEERVAAIIELKVSPQKNTGFDEIAEQIVGFDEVESVYLMSGGYDLSLTLHAKSFKDIAYFVSERLAPIEGVLSTATHFILHRYKDNNISFGSGKTDGRSEFNL